MAKSRPPSEEGQADFERIWSDAVDKYKDITGKPLDRTASIKWDNVTSVDALMKYIDDGNNSFKKLRGKRKKIREVLEPVVDCVGALNAVVANAAKLVSSPGSLQYWCSAFTLIDVASPFRQQKPFSPPSHCSARYLLSSAPRDCI
jgi:hypothetical protein